MNEGLNEALLYIVLLGKSGTSLIVDQIYSVENVESDYVL